MTRSHFLKLIKAIILSNLICIISACPFLNKGENLLDKSSLPSFHPPLINSMLDTVETAISIEAAPTNSKAPSKKPIQTVAPSKTKVPSKKPIQTIGPSKKPTQTIAPSKTKAPVNAPPNLLQESFSYVGCYGDSFASRAMATTGGYVQSIQDCAKFARSSGCTHFGSQKYDGGNVRTFVFRCFCANDFNSITKYGKSSNCVLGEDKKYQYGGLFTNAVYSLSGATKNSTTIVPPKVLHKSFSFPKCEKNDGAKVVYSQATLCEAYSGIKSLFNAKVNSLKSQNTDVYNKQLASMFGKAVRMVFHDAVDLDLTKQDLMGADGCIGDAIGSAGLIEPTSPIFNVYEPMYQAYCDKINRADFFVLIGKLVIEISEPTNSIKLSYQYGRRESYECSAAVGRDPSGQGGMDVIKQAFITQMGLTYEDAVLLMGAHTLGHVNPENSGYDGHPGWKPSDFPRANPITVNAWDQTPTVFDNDYYFQIRNIPWGKIYNNPFTFATKRTDTNIWVDFTCGGRSNSYPTAVTINTCLTPKPRIASMNIALNTDMIMTFPLDRSNDFSSAGGNTGAPLEHCIDNLNEPIDVPFPKHYPNQPGREMRCYGPVLRKDSPWPPAEVKSGNPPFFRRLESDSNKDKGFIDQQTDLPLSDPDPVGINVAAKETFAIFARYSVNTYQDGTAAGLAAHKRFITDFAKSWTNMITAGYSNSYNNKNGKLGTLTTFDFSTQCPSI